MQNFFFFTEVNYYFRSADFAQNLISSQEGDYIRKYKIWNWYLQRFDRYRGHTHRHTHTHTHTHTQRHFLKTTFLVSGDLKTWTSAKISRSKIFIITILPYTTYKKVKKWGVATTRHSYTYESVTSGPNFEISFIQKIFQIQL